MINSVRRARVTLLAALLASAAIVATQFPLNQLLGERTAVQQESRQLAALKAENRSLAAQVSALHQPGTIARLAHQKYGLVLQGQQSLVILPSVGGQPGSSSSSLGATVVPRSDLVPSDALISPSSGVVGGTAGNQQGFWRKLVQRLEFWKAVP